MADDLHLNTGGFGARELFGLLDAGIHQMLDVTLETAAEITEHGRSTTEDDILVESLADIHGRRLHHLIDNHWERGEELGGRDLRGEEDLRGHEALVTDVDAHGAAGGKLAFVFLEPLGLLVELLELLDDVGAGVAELLFDAFCGAQGGVGLASVTEHALDEGSDIAAGDGDVLDVGADNVSLGHGNDVGDTITAIDHGSSEGLSHDLGGGPGRCESQHGLDCDVEAGTIEGLKHDLGRHFAVLWGVERGLSEQEPVVLGLAPQVLEDRGLPEPLHLVPVLDLAVANRVAEAVLCTIGLGDRLVADEVRRH